MKTFVDAVLNGETAQLDIDDWIDRWHNGGSGDDLHDFLGMSLEEYAKWVVEPDALDSIIEQRRRVVNRVRRMVLSFDNDEMSLFRAAIKGRVDLFSSMAAAERQGRKPGPLAEHWDERAEAALTLLARIDCEIKRCATQPNIVGIARVIDGGSDPVPKFFKE